MKKYFLDDRAEERDMEQLKAEDFVGLRQNIGGSLNFEHPLDLLRRKSEIICKLHKKDGSYAELIQQL